MARELELGLAHEVVGGSDTYGTETAMGGALDINDRTGGRSTDLFGDRDVHAYFVPEFLEIPADTPR